MNALHPKFTHLFWLLKRPRAHGCSKRDRQMRFVCATQSHHRVTSRTSLFSQLKFYNAACTMSYVWLQFRCMQSSLDASSTYHGTVRIGISNTQQQMKLMPLVQCIFCFGNSSWTSIVILSRLLIKSFLLTLYGFQLFHYSGHFLFFRQSE